MTVWEFAVRAGEIPAFLLPAPSQIAAAFAGEAGYYIRHAAITAGEIAAGLAAGALVGALTAAALSLSEQARRLVGPVLVASQALPVFAIAPLLVIWFGFGIVSKIVMAALIIYFPVATTFADGLNRTDPNLVDIARLNGSGRFTILRLIRIPAALPSLGSGLRVAATIAPIGAIVGEWVGASGGLGFVMLQANARMQTDRVFVALAILAIMALGLRALLEFALRHILFWVPGEGTHSPQST